MMLRSARKCQGTFEMFISTESHNTFSTDNAIEAKHQKALALTRAKAKKLRGIWIDLNQTDRPACDAARAESRRDEEQKMIGPGVYEYRGHWAYRQAIRPAFGHRTNGWYIYDFYGASSTIAKNLKAAVKIIDHHIYHYDR